VEASAAQLGPLLGRGRTADVYASGEGRVIKLFHADRPSQAVERERSIAELLNTLRVPVPRYEGALRVGDRTGLIFERIDGDSMLKSFSRRPWLAPRLARQLAELHHALHAHTAPDLPRQRGYLQSMIERAPGLLEVTRLLALEGLERLPDGDRLCHGDFHPDNVVLSRRGFVVLDWMTATRGVPAGDVARSLLLLEIAALPAETPRFVAVVINAIRRVFARHYWRRYATLSGLRRADLEPWRLPLLAARLSEAPPEVERERVLTLLSSLSSCSRKKGVNDVRRWPTSRREC
jgi:aminoglycoside phosphotransferase (APT) family kinase protein